MDDIDNPQLIPDWNQETPSISDWRNNDLVHRRGIKLLDNTYTSEQLKELEVSSLQKFNTALRMLEDTEGNEKISNILRGSYRGLITVLDSLKQHDHS